MIDCLSNPVWIHPQTNYLLLLQNIRLGHLAGFDKLFLSVTVFGEYWLPTLICAITYWCIDFKAGIYLFTLNSFNILFAHLFKMIACVYRPWILDNRIQPSALAVPFARGYSFPSGHSAVSSSVFGGSAYLLRRNRVFVTLLVGIILLVGFSRLWLGVHTLQDVAGGFLIGIILVFSVPHLIEWAERDKNRYMFLLMSINFLAALALIYISYFNTYRMDYVDGELLVNPQKSIYTMVVIYGYALGLINGAFLCRRFLPFDPKNASVKCRIIRGIVGTLLIFILLKLALAFIFLNTMNLKLAIFLMFLIGISITLVYPVLFTKTVK